jgi:3-dehydroquinate dehydratase-2
MATGSRNRVAVLHGANLDQLGGRDPEHYGDLSLAQIQREVRGWGRDLGLEAIFFQTNHEGEFIEYLHRLPETADGAIINAGAWTHYSYAIRDALEFAGLPVIEVHLSDVMKREKWRHHSVFEDLDLVLAAISGKKVEGYKEALEILAEKLNSK